MELIGTSLFTTANTIAYYRFENGALTTDSKGSNTLTNNSTVADGQGIYGGGADYGSSNSSKYFNRNDDIGIDGNSDLSINMWIKPDTIGSGTTYRLASHRSTSGADRYFLAAYQNPSGTEQMWVNASGTQFTYNVDLGNTWNMVTFVRENGGDSYIYVNGRLGNSDTTGTDTGGANDIVIGRQENASSNFFSGVMDDVAYFDKALSAAEISQLYSSGAGAVIGLL